MATLPFSEKTYENELDSVIDILLRLKTQLKEGDTPGLSAYGGEDASAEHWREVGGELAIAGSKCAGLVDAIVLRFGG